MARWEKGNNFARCCLGDICGKPAAGFRSSTVVRQGKNNGSHKLKRLRKMSITGKDAEGLVIGAMFLLYHSLPPLKDTSSHYKTKPTVSREEGVPCQSQSPYGGTLDTECTGPQKVTDKNVNWGGGAWVLERFRQVPQELPNVPLTFIHIPCHNKNTF